jgi:hypothetical protein
VIILDKRARAGEEEMGEAALVETPAEEPPASNESR